MNKPQLDMFSALGDAQPVAPVAGLGDPARVRAKLDRIVEEARTADAMPWDPAKLALYRKIVPQMVRWLPEDEAEAYRTSFDAEIARLA